MDVEQIKNQFEILKTNPNISYLDNAASTLTPDSVLKKMNEYYTKYRANIHRGLYKFSDTATQEYEKAREKVAQFIGADTNEIVFTSGTTHSLNMLAYGLCKNLKAGDNVVITEMEHHANMVPWQVMSKKYGFELRYIPVTNFELDMDAAEKLIDKNTKIVSFIAVSNTLGTINSIEKLVVTAKKVNAISIVDYAQAISTIPVNIKKLDCDFLVFSGHKMYGPTGIGVLYGKMNQLEELDPFIYGGGMIQEVTLKNSTWTEVPGKFEGGTPHIAGAIGLGAAVDAINEIGWEEIVKHRKDLTNYLVEELSKVATIIGVQDAEKRVGVVSFVIDGVHPHDIADILDKHNVAIRAGHHCTEPLIKKLELHGTARVSIGLYNTREDIDKLIAAINKVKDIFN